MLIWHLSTQFQGVPLYHTIDFHFFHHWPGVSSVACADCDRRREAFRGPGRIQNKGHPFHLGLEAPRQHERRCKLELQWFLVAATVAAAGVTVVVVVVVVAAAAAVVVVVQAQHPGTAAQHQMPSIPPNHIESKNPCSYLENDGEFLKKLESNGVSLEVFVCDFVDWKCRGEPPTKAAVERQSLFSVSLMNIESAVARIKS